MQLTIITFNKKLKDTQTLIRQTQIPNKDNMIERVAAENTELHSGNSLDNSTTSLGEDVNVLPASQSRGLLEPRGQYSPGAHIPPVSLILQKQFTETLASV